jgi:outer membrane murein-binding lipoprotein Lpp
VYGAYGTVVTLRKGRAKLMRRKAVLGAFVGAVFVLAAGCTSSTQEHKASTQEHKASTKEKASAREHKAYNPHIDPAEFTTKIDNEYLPMKPGTTFVYEGGAEHDEMSVTHDTKKVMGVECVVVDDRAWEDGKLIERTYDWFAQDNKGNVWYFGEDTKEYKNGKVTSTHGSWEAGVDGAKPGIIMQAHPKVGQVYRQEYYKGEAEDIAKVQSLNESVKVTYGSFDHVLETKEWTPLEPSYDEHKYYARGVGQVYGGGSELVAVKPG